MTEKEKAKELVERFERTFVILIKNSKNNLVSPYKSGYLANKVYGARAKKCALICVDEIINILPTSVFFHEIEYWQNVKKEIELL